MRDERDERDLEPGFSICFTTDRIVNLLGEAIDMTLKVLNRSREEISLQFKDSQRFDFIVEGNGEWLWSWSDGRTFAQVMGEEKLMPGQSIIYKARFEGKLKPGTYRITAMVVQKEIPLLTSSVLVVRR